MRNETRDAEDLWRCREVAAAEGVSPVDFDDPALSGLRQLHLFTAPAAGVRHSEPTLQAMGYGNVAHLDGGITAWKEAGKPVE